MALSPGSPTEEESALGLMTGLSPYLSWMFPNRAEHYRRYLTFRNVSPKEVERWKAAYVSLVKKLSRNEEGPLVLKSPPNTCRIRLLLEIFPNAKFVHIHRNPYVVYQSTRHLMGCALKIHGFQVPDFQDLHRWIIQQFQTMYEVYFEERGLIPTGRHCEVAFEELETNPIGQMERVYQELDLSDFAVVRPVLEEYLYSLSDYKKNVYPDLSPAKRSDIARAWHRCFEEWGYTIDER
jgi:hypothetical protein